MISKQRKTNLQLWVYISIVLVVFILSTSSRDVHDDHRILLFANAWSSSAAIGANMRKKFSFCRRGGPQQQQQQQQLLLPGPVRAGSIAVRDRAKDRDDDDINKPKPRRQSLYDLGLGKNKPLVGDGAEEHSLKTRKLSNTNDDKNNDDDYTDDDDAVRHWVVNESVHKMPEPSSSQDAAVVAAAAATAMASLKKMNQRASSEPVTTRKMVAVDNEGQDLRAALWHEQHYSDDTAASAACAAASVAFPNGQPLMDNNPGNYGGSSSSSSSLCGPKPPTKFYPDFDLSIPDTVYCEEKNIDIVWDLLRWEAYQEAQREPLLVSFLHSTILNHPSLESSLAFLLANRLSGPMMISTQLQSLILNALQSCCDFRRSVRADMLAVRDRDPACTCLPDVFLYFKGFQALQSHRVAHSLWNQNKHVLAHYLQSQVSQIFQIDIHPNATLKSGIMLDHGTGIVIGETATVGYNCSILHHVTLGGSGKKGVDRHPKVGDGVLLGAGSTVLGNVQIGEGCQIGAGTLVISDLKPHCVAVGVPARIIGSFVDVTEQPSIGMDQMMSEVDHRISFQYGGI